MNFEPRPDTHTHSRSIPPHQLMMSCVCSAARRRSGGLLLPVRRRADVLSRTRGRIMESFVNNLHGRPVRSGNRSYDADGRRQMTGFDVTDADGS